jgi:tyrosine-protein kinase Etk/Wzc
MVENEVQEREVNLVSEIKETVLAFWPLFVLGLALAFTGAFVYLRYTPAVYQANAKLLIKDDTKTGYTAANKVLSQLDAFGTKTNVDNEIVIIQSRSILREAAIKSNSYVTVFSNGRVTDRIQPNFPVRFQPLNPDSLKGGSKEFNITDSEIVFGSNRYPLKDSVLVDEGLNTPFMLFVNEGEIASVKNENFSLRARSLESEVGALAGGFKAEATSKQASVIDLSITALDPKLAEKALQAILHTEFH